MNERMKDMKKFLIIIIVAAFSLPTMAQGVSNPYSDPSSQTVVPSATFQSTSAMQGIGSAYSSNPTIGANGTATYSGASYAPVNPGGGPRKSGAFDDDDDDMPIGDAVLPLIMLMGIYCAVRVYKHKRSVEKTLKK